MRRDFGHVYNGHAPVGGYQQPQQPHFVSERGNFPIPRPPAPYQFAKTLLATEGVMESEDLHASPDTFSEQLGNPELPVAEFRDAFKDAIKENPVVIMVGETGSGKSTQTPQYALEAGFTKIVQTQPRRIAAYGVAERIDQEIKNTLGSERSVGLVGYRTAGASTVTAETKIIVQTDGIEAIQQLNDTKFDGKEIHFIDEVHEWNSNIELTVAVIKKKLKEDPNAHFVITSATMAAHQLADYFSEATGKLTPVIEVPGRMYPVERFEKPNSTVVREILSSVEECPDEDILVFVPGKREISDTIDAVQAQLPASIRGEITLLPLHAKLSKAEQDRINQKTAGRKIIISTNVAQTSLTIPGIGIVIDSGLERHIELDEEGVQGLGVHPVSQADCDQRAGRTGRIAPGQYTLTRFDANSEFVPYIRRPKYGRAEILRTDIDRTTLRIAAAVGLDIAELDFFHPVDPAVIERSKTSLYSLGALDEDGKVTPPGMQMNAFPVRPSSARMLCEVAGAPTMVRAQLAAIVASIEVGGLPYFAHDVGKSWQQLTNEKTSDLLAQLDLFLASQEMTDSELTMHDLDVQNVRRAQELYRKISLRSNSVVENLLPPNEAERDELKRAIYTGLIDWVYAHVGDGQYERISQTADFTTREISNRSVVSGTRPRLVVGSPYRVEFVHRGEASERHIIENLTVIDDPRILGSIATAHLVGWELKGHVWRDGQLMHVMRQKFNGIIDLGLEREVVAAPTLENRQYMLKSLLETPGPAQQKLRSIKKELEELAHLSREDVPQLTQDMLVELLNDAIGSGSLEQSRIDNRLRELAQERNITLDRFISRESRNKIREQAPAHIALAGVELSLTYRRGIPVVTRYHEHTLARFADGVHLPDGREVLFVHDKRALPLSALREKLAAVAL